MLRFSVASIGQVRQLGCFSGVIWPLPNPNSQLLCGAASEDCCVPTRALLGGATPCQQGGAEHHPGVGQGTLV